tara:strand:+ start:538 stop:816 length:279 start_codon:yes stop_codon:yes gene_type:complete
MCPICKDTEEVAIGNEFESFLVRCVCILEKPRDRSDRIQSLSDLEIAKADMNQAKKLFKEEMDRHMEAWEILWDDVEKYKKEYVKLVKEKNG